MKRDILFKWTGADIVDGYYIGGVQVDVPNGYWVDGTNTGLPDGYYVDGVEVDPPEGIVIPTFAGYSILPLFSQPEWSNAGSYITGAVLTPSVTIPTFDGEPAP